MKKLLSLVLALTCIFSVFTLCTGASAADGLTLQNISYDEYIGRIDQSDAGFTRASTYIYSTKITESTVIPSDYGYQFYYIDLGKYSENRGGIEVEIDDAFLNYLYKRLQNLRNNGGACMIRVSYAIDGQNTAEPNDFNLLLTHQAQLAAVFSDFSDIITSVECGMIGAFGEMWGGLYSDESHKRQVLDGWLTGLPDEISVNVRTLGEYTYYVNNSDLYKSQFRKKTINGVTYPATFATGNFFDCRFPAGTLFNRIGMYNDAMIQDGNDGGTFPIKRNIFMDWLSDQTQSATYGGEFSGASGKNGYDCRLNSTWLPMNAIPEFYKAHLSYYHGGNRAYVDTGTFKSTGVTTKKYSSNDAAVSAATQVMENYNKYGLGMNFKAELQDDGVTVKYTTGGWSTATVSNELFDAIKKTANTVCDFSAYNGKKVSSFFEDHIGYRIVLKESYLNASVDKGGVLTVKGKVENTGFSNVPGGKVTEIIITDGVRGYTLKTSSINTNNWKSGTSNDYITEIKLPANIDSGEWQVYMRVATQYTDSETNQKVTNAKSCIRFANEGSFSYNVLGTGAYDGSSYTASLIYNSDICGNYLGKFTVTENTVKNSDNSIKQVYVSTFKDTKGHWAEKFITPICSLGYMSGTSSTTFEPDVKTSRAMLVRVLYSIEGSPSVEGLSNPFKDVKNGEWYTSAVIWAYHTRVVSGTTETTFSPNDNITREQFASILYRYAKSVKGIDVSSQADLSKFTDAGKISSYAKEAISWANAEGYINGMTPTALEPKSSSTRAQMATILSKFLDNL